MTDHLTRRSVLAAGCGLALPPFASAQSTHLTQGVPTKYAGKRIRVVMPNHPWSDTLQPLVDEFRKARGAAPKLHSTANERRFAILVET